MHCASQSHREQLGMPQSTVSRFANATMWYTVAMTRKLGTCEFENCGRIAQLRRGLCGMHYRRLQRYGSPVRGRLTALERFERSFAMSTGCWLWDGEIDRDGYGHFWAGRRVMAHRFSYEAYIGPIPEGMQIDHVKARGCTSRSCINPAHLEAVTQLENRRRALVLNSTCGSGHPYSGRLCAECNRLRAKNYYRKNREKILLAKKTKREAIQAGSVRAR